MGGTDFRLLAIVLSPGIIASTFPPCKLSDLHPLKRPLDCNQLFAHVGDSIERPFDGVFMKSTASSLAHGC